MTLWYLMVDHIPIDRNGDPDGPAIKWAHGRDGTCIPADDFSTAWLETNGYKTRAAAKRAVVPSLRKMCSPVWREAVTVVSGDVPDRRLKYKIFKCYEIVVVDNDGNQIGASQYRYGDMKDAEETGMKMLKAAEGEGLA